MTVLCLEIGSNHLGDLKRAKEMCNAIAENGGHIAKVQMFKLEQYPHNIYTPYKWYDILEEHCARLGIGFLASWFYVPEKIPAVVKLAYSQRHNFNLIKAFEKAGSKLIVSGDKNTLWPESCHRMYCVPKYPAKKENYKDWDSFISFSDHTCGIDFALRMKPFMLEKHFKLGDEIEKKNPDSGAFAITPKELKELSETLK